MKIKLLLTLLIITLITIAIISGCGGGSGTTQVTSLVTPTPNMTDNMAYITIKVKWPEQGMAGKLIMSSSGNEEKEITASMPNGTNRIDVKVYNFKDKDPNAPVVFDPNIFLAGGYVLPPYTTTTIPVPIKTDPNDPNSNILPAIPVKIWAGAFGASGDINDPNSALLSTEHYMILKVGNQTANLQLGNYFIEVVPEYAAIGNPGETIVTANLSLLYPSPTPGRNVKGKQIIFTIDPVASTIDPNNVNITQQTAVTDENGNSTALFKAGPDF